MYYLLKALELFLFIIVKPIRAISHFIFAVFLVRLYRIYRLVKNWLGKLFSPAKNKLLYPFSTKFIAHALIVIIALLVVINNLDIREIRAEEFGNNSLISSLLKNEENDIVETIDASTQTKTAGQSVAVSDALNPKEANDNSEKELNETITAETQGALLNPSITPEASNQPRYNVEYYIVEGGDTISSIAVKFNLNPNTILWENRLGPKDYIKPGDKLTILPTDGVSRQVKKGDTLEKIAKTYSADINTILEYNRLVDASDISENEILIIPGGQVSEPAAPKVTTTPNLQIPPPARVPASSRLLWPTVSHKINQYFKWRHTGIDLDGDYSSPIYAADSGRVEYAGFARNGYGNHIIINHGGGKQTLYAHASKIFVRKGDYVEKGQTIAMIGCTGWCSGTHLHFEIIVSGRKVNPLSYL